MSFKLIIITPENKLFEDDVDCVTVPGVDGSFSILENHAPMIGGMGSGKLLIKKTGEDVEYFVDNGFVEISNNVVSVLADKAKQA